MSLPEILFCKCRKESQETWVKVRIDFFFPANSSTSLHSGATVPWKLAVVGRQKLSPAAHGWTWAAWLICIVVVGPSYLCLQVLLTYFTNPNTPFHKHFWEYNQGTSSTIISIYYIYTPLLPPLPTSSKICKNAIAFHRTAWFSYPHLQEYMTKMIIDDTNWVLLSLYEDFSCYWENYVCCRSTMAHVFKAYGAICLIFSLAIHVNGT